MEIFNISHKHTQYQTGTDQNEVSDGFFLTNKELNLKVIEKFLLDGLFTAQEALEALLGVSLNFSEQMTGNFKKKETASKSKCVLTRFKISGDKESEGYILLPSEDAVYFGRSLTNMPMAGIAETLKSGKFEDESAGAFGEITSILINCYASHFETYFPLKLTFKKEGKETLFPAQTDLFSNGFFKSDNYFMVSTMIRMEGKIYGPLEILFPSEIIELPKPEEFREISEEKKTAKQESYQTQSRQPASEQKTDTVSGPHSHEDRTRIISVISQDKSLLEILKKNLTQENLEVMLLSPECDLKQYLNHKNLCCVFLFIKKVNDLGFAQTIKVRTSLKKKCPLIVAGPEWTRNQVLKALKYGATDIMIIPTERESILKKFQKHLIKQSGINHENYPA